jgi:hypothetical protein
VSDDEVARAMRELAAAGLAIGESGAAPLAALRALTADPACAGLRTPWVWAPPPGSCSSRRRARPTRTGTAARSPPDDPCVSVLTEHLFGPAWPGTYF